MKKDLKKTTLNCGYDLEVVRGVAEVERATAELCAGILRVRRLLGECGAGGPGRPVCGPVVDGALPGKAWAKILK
jgi:hypothetical protein